MQLYGGVYNLFRSGLPRMGIDVTMVDIFDTNNLKKCLRPQTKLVWLEACTNPLVMLADLEATIKAVKEFNAEIIVGIDNTFLSPWILVCMLEPSLCMCKYFDSCHRKVLKKGMLVHYTLLGILESTCAVGTF